MPTVEVTDPVTGETALIAIRWDGRRPIYQRLKRSIVDPHARTARELESQAAFAEAASSAFGMPSRVDEPAACEPVRHQVPRALLRSDLPRESAREKRQVRLEAMIPPELRALGIDLARMGSHVRLREVQRPDVEASDGAPASPANDSYRRPGDTPGANAFPAGRLVSDGRSMGWLADPQTSTKPDTSRPSSNQ